jgi:hypothetical protein
MCAGNPRIRSGYGSDRMSMKLQKIRLKLSGPVVPPSELGGLCGDP